MATGLTSTANFGSAGDTWVHRAVLQRPKDHLIHNICAQEFELPVGETQNITFQRDENLNSDPVALNENYDPAPDQLMTNNITVGLQEFGKVVLLSRKVLIVVENDAANRAVDNLSQCMHTMLDKVTRDVIDSTASQISCLYGSNGNAITEYTEKDKQRQIAYLDDNNTLKVAPKIEGSSKFGTGPVEAAYWLLGHVNLKPDFRALDSFLPTVAYGSQTPVLQEEYGSVDEARILLSTLVNKSADATPVYSNTMIGAGALGRVKIDQVSMQTVVKPLGALDRLDRFQSIGSTSWFASGILDDSHIITALSTKAD